MHCGFMDSRLRRFPPDRASAVSYGQTVGNATRCPPLAHRSAAAHKLHSAQSNRYKIRESQNQIPGTGLSLFLPGDCPNDRDHRRAGVAIDTKHVKTEVLVENGGTVVIGGVYTQTILDNTQRIPFFGDLPYIGWLFKNREWIDDKTELLVFITPKIVAEGLSVR